MIGNMRRIFVFIKYTQEQINELILRTKDFKPQQRHSNLEKPDYFDDRSFWTQLKQENPVQYVELFDSARNQPTPEGYTQELCFYLARQLNPNTPDQERVWNHSDFYKAVYGDLVQLKRTRVDGEFAYAGTGTRFKNMTFTGKNVENFAQVAQALVNSTYLNVSYENTQTTDELAREYRAYNDEASYN